MILFGVSAEAMQVRHRQSRGVSSDGRKQEVLRHAQIREPEQRSEEDLGGGRSRLTARDSLGRDPFEERFD
jgi:hypothetical protein